MADPLRITLFFFLSLVSPTVRQPRERFLILLCAGLSFLRRRRRKWKENLEEWELNCPHRFKYKDLYKDTQLLGVAGFGEVYKGVLPTTGSEVAVKKILSNSSQGMREFAAEIETLTLGRLRHKNLVNLLLVYDYVPNWEQRLNILRGIASGLLYMHEDREQVVIHRDVKSSNVLIDEDMNPRLGDFGLARLYDLGQNSHTTNVVGTIGYIAPELIQTGKASTSSDVYAFGVVVLEVACGRKPIVHDANHGQVMLRDRVMQCHQDGRILDAADPKLGSGYVEEEMQMMLTLGLLCCHPNQQFRPTMRDVLKYLKGDEPLPAIQTPYSTFAVSMQIEETASIGGVMSSGSIGTGR